MQRISVRPRYVDHAWPMAKPWYRYERPLGTGALSCCRSALANVRFGSKADICSAKRHVRFTPESGHSALQTTKSVKIGDTMPSAGTVYCAIRKRFEALDSKMVASFTIRSTISAAGGISAMRSTASPAITPAMSKSPSSRASEYFSASSFWC